MAKYLTHADVYYGHKSPQWYHIVGFMRLLRQHNGDLPAAEFKAKRLKDLRELWIAQGWARSHVNAQVDRLWRMFK